MEFLRNLTLKRAAKRYARELPGELRRAYGAAGRYTVAQIRAAVTALALDERFVALAYAGYLTEAEFAPLASSVGARMSYAEARALLDKYRPHGGFSGGASGASDRSGDTDLPDASH
jgi:hypothetical protein